MRKNEPPHVLEIFVKLDNKGITGKCSCVAGASGYCHHIIGLLFYMAHCKMFGLASLPDDLTCTSMPQRWSVPRGKHIGTNEIQSVLVKKPRIGANYNKFIKSTLYSPSTSYRILCKSDFSRLDPLPLEADIAPTAEEMPNLILQGVTLALARSPRRVSKVSGERKSSITRPFGEYDFNCQEII